MTTPPGDDSQPYGEPDHGQPPAGPPGYGQPQQGPPGYSPPGYGQPGAPAPYQGGYGPMAPPDHPKATTSLVLGIIGLMACQVVSPFAWSMGKKTVAEIDASGGRLGGRGTAQVGYVLGIIGTVLLGLALAFLVIWLVIVLVAIGSTATA